MFWPYTFSEFIGFFRLWSAGTSTSPVTQCVYGTLKREKTCTLSKGAWKGLGTVWGQLPLTPCYSHFSGSCMSYTVRAKFQMTIHSDKLLPNNKNRTVHAFALMVFVNALTPCTAKWTATAHPRHPWQTTLSRTVVRSQLWHFRCTIISFSTLGLRWQFYWHYTTYSYGWLSVMPYSMHRCIIWQKHRVSPR